MITMIVRSQLSALLPHITILTQHINHSLIFISIPSLLSPSSPTLASPSLTLYLWYIEIRKYKYLIIIFMIFVSLCLLLACIHSGKIAQKVDYQHDFWKEIIHLEGTLKPEEYSLSGLSNLNSNQNVEVVQFLYSNLTQRLIVYQHNGSILIDCFSEMKKTESWVLGGIYQTSTNHCRNVKFYIQYVINEGLITSTRIEFEGKVINYYQKHFTFFLPAIVFLIIILTLILLLRISNQALTIIKELKKRTPLVTLWGTILKLALISIIMATAGFSYLMGADGFFWKLVWMGLFAFGLVFGFMHLLFLAYTSYRAMADDKDIKQMSQNKKFVLVGVFFFLILATCIVLLVISKGFWIYYVLSLNVIYLFGSSIKKKMFPSGMFIVYDFLLMLILSLSGLFYPAAKFSLISLKHFILFWNYQGFTFLIGLFMMKRFIQMEIVQEVIQDDHSFQSEEQRKEMKVYEKSETEAEVN